MRAASNACRDWPEEGAAREHVHVRVEDGGEHGDRAAGRAQLGQRHADRGGVVLAEQHEDQHVGRHRQRQHERPVEPAPAGEVVERDRARRASRRAAACRGRRRPPARASRAARRAAGSAAIESSASPSPTNERGQHQQRRDDERRDGDRGDGPAGAGYSHPTRCMSSTAAASDGPACSTSIGSVFTSGPVADVLGRRHVGVGGELAVLHDRLLRLAGGEELHQADRVRALLAGALDEPDAGDVGVRAGAVLVGPRGRDREVGVVLQLACEVVVVGEPDVAVAGGDRLEHVDVGAEDLRVVGHDRLEQLLGLGLAVLGDPVGDPRLVVLVVARAQADAAAELGLARSA